MDILNEKVVDFLYDIAIIILVRNKRFWTNKTDKMLNQYQVLWKETERLWKRTTFLKCFATRTMTTFARTAWRHVTVASRSKEIPDSLIRINSEKPPLIERGFFRTRRACAFSCILMEICYNSAKENKRYGSFGVLAHPEACAGASPTIHNGHSPHRNPIISDCRATHKVLS